MNWKKYQLIIITILLSPCLVKAQSSKWAYMFTAKDGGVYRADTLTSDVKQLSEYDNHYKVVIFWVDVKKTTHVKKVSHTHEFRYRMAFDTTNRQFEIKDWIEYKDGVVLKSDFDEVVSDWRSVVPDTFAESILMYAKRFE